MKLAHRTAVVAGVLSVGSACVAVGCGDDDSAPVGFDSGIDLGFDSSSPGIDDAAPAEAAVDASVEDVRAPDADAAVVDAADAGDAGDAGDAEGDAGDGKNALFAHIDETLVTVNPTTGAIATVGVTEQKWIVLAWDATAKVARIVLNPFSAVGGPPTPALGTIDLCTGNITPGPAITVGGVQVRRSEGLVQDPATGKFFISYGTSGNSSATEFVSEKTGTIDVATGAVTNKGSHGTLQNDGDNLMFLGASLKLLDVATSVNNGALYDLNPVTGAASNPITTGPALLRVTYDPTRDVVFTAAGTGNEPSVSARSIGTLDRTTGANTSLGTVLANGDHTGHHFNGILSAPKPVCP